MKILCSFVQHTTAMSQYLQLIQGRSPTLDLSEGSSDNLQFGKQPPTLC